MAFSQADKLKDPMLHIVEPIWDAPGLTDAQKVRAISVVGACSLDVANTYYSMCGEKALERHPSALTQVLDIKVQDLENTLAGRCNPEKTPKLPSIPTELAELVAVRFKEMVTKEYQPQRLVG